MTDHRIALADMNAASPGEFDSLVAPMFENAPWVTEGLAAMRPFASVTALHKAMIARMYAAPPEAQLALLRGHPALSPATLRRGTTAESTAEQHSAGLAALEDATAARLDAANAAYQARFGFPFILAVRHASLSTIFAAMERRLGSAQAAEVAEALREVEAISWMRLLDRIVPAPTGGISLHVLDTVRTRPAAMLAGELWSYEPGGPTGLVASFVTDERGRAGTMLGGGALVAAGYEWRLDTAAYLARQGLATPDRGFLPMITVRFAVTNPEEHFHVPVLLSHGAYTAYRGS